MTHTEMVMTAGWDLRLVALSYVVAVFASYTALDLAGKVAVTSGWANRIWLAGGAFAMGTGIWAMHFTGMQAFKMPMPVTYNVPVTLLSMLIAIAASALALFVVSRRMLRTLQLLTAGSVMGVGIATMHYTGMAAMQMSATIRYDPLLVTLSVLIAIIASIAALWLAFRFSIASNAGGRWQWAKGGSALVMGAAIVGMHYTGMAAANFVPIGEGTAEAGSGIDTIALGFWIGIITLLILGIALVSSIVDRKFSAQAAELEKTERHYESLFRHNPDAVYSLDLEGRFLTANLAMEQMLASVAQHLRQKLFTDFIIGEDQEEARRHFEEAVRGEPQNYEVTVTDKTGNRVDLSVTSIPIVVEDEIVGVYGIAKDITERKRAEEAHSQLAAIVESSDDAIFSRTLNGTISTWNRGAEKLFGYSAEEAIGQTASTIIVPPDCRNELTEILARAEQGESTSNYETVRATKDGRLIDVFLTVSPIKDSEGNVIGSSTITRDITERKLAEQELEQAKEQAEAASRAKSDFLAIMSHEIRTPMNGVIGMTSLLLDTDLDPEQREYAETARSSGENLLTIINDILDFSKIEAGKMELEIIDFDLRSAVEETVGLLAERSYDKNLELASLVEYDVPTALKGDPGRIRQVLTNLLGNAVKFTEEGEVVLRVRLVEGSEDVAVVRFEVKDTGIGMSQEQQTQLFQSFSQADASTTRRYGGTGLGLAISKQLVELMGGEIGAESELEAGSTFFFTLPLKKQPEETQPATPKPLVDLQGLRVLVVDDNETNCKIVHHQIISWGMKNGEAKDGQSALEMLHAAAERGEPYHLAILDMQMPKMDGLMLAKMIKDDPTIASTRLVLLTSMSRRGDGEEARQAGIEVYLNKPVRQSQLYDVIATVMSKQVEPEETVRLEHQAQLVARHNLRETKARSRARILIAEDNSVNQKVAVRMLEKLGYRADVAANGLEAVEALSRIPYAAVLMDVQMPEMDGYEATREIRRREREAGGERDTSSRHLPVIAMTANALEGDREKALAAGMDDYVSKPVKPAQLSEILERWTADAKDAELPPEGAGAAHEADANGHTGPEDPLDPDVLAGLRELGDAELLAELVELFVDDTPSRILALGDALEKDDAEAVERVAHTLKGSCGNMGAWRMAEICENLQEMGGSGDLSGASELVEQLEAEFGRARQALEAELTKERP